MRRVSTTIDVKISNAIKLYTQLRMHSGFSKAELARRVHLSFASVSNMCTELERHNLVTVEYNSKSTGGRKAASVTFNSSFAYTLVIDMHHTQHIYVSIVDLENRLIDSRRFEVLPTDTLDTVLQNIRRTSSALTENHRYHIIGVAVGISAAFNPVTKTLLQSANPLFERVRLTTYLEEIFPDTPIHIENDANLAALSQSDSIERSQKNLLCIFFTQGIGLGIMIHGQLYLGSNGFAGELGHLKVPEGTKRCKCGSIGCLRTETTLESMAEDLGELSYLLSLPSSAQYAQELADRYTSGDKNVRVRIDRTALIIGEVMAELFDLFNPEEILLAGNLGPLFPFIRNLIKARSQSLSNLSREVDLQIRCIEDKTFELIQKGGAEKAFISWVEEYISSLFLEE